MIVALVLAAGRGERFAARHSKLLEELHGRAMARRVVDAALGSRADRTIVVTGYDHLRVDAALAGLPVETVYNGRFAEGMSVSLRMGLAHAKDADGLVVMLGDMPNVTTSIVDQLIDAFKTNAAGVVPVYRGRRGNPVLVGRALFPLIERIHGDVGARAILRTRDDIIEIEVDDPAICEDVDTAQDLERLRAAQAPAP